MDLFGSPAISSAASVALAPPAGADFTTSDLHGRGWTKAAIRLFLSGPDIVEKKNRGGWRYTEHRYKADRVRKAETSSDFLEWLGERDARRAAAQRGVDRAVAAAAAWAPVIPQMTMTMLRASAIQAFNQRLYCRMERRGDWSGRSALADSDSRFLARISVNHLRHSATRYDELLVVGQFEVPVRSGRT